MFLLRWGFEYLNGTRKTGMWSNPGHRDDLATKAWCHNKNVRYAFIEAKNVQTREVKEVVRCDGQKFRNFQWIAVRHLFSGATKQVGISLLSSDESVDVLANGTAKRGPVRNENINFATYGK